MRAMEALKSAAPKTYMSGAGAKPTATVHYAHTEGSVRPYRVGTHQHTPEIELLLDRASGVATSVTFVPHLVPAVRGVLVTCYARLTEGSVPADLAAVLSDAYDGAPFVPPAYWARHGSARLRYSLTSVRTSGGR